MSAITKKRLNLAFRNLKQERAQTAPGCKAPRMSIMAVAKRAGYSHTLIHNDYPDLAEKIRAASRGTLLDQRRKKHATLKIARARITALRLELKLLRCENRGLASENARLTLANSALALRNQALEAGATPLARAGKPKY